MQGDNNNIKSGKISSISSGRRWQEFDPIYLDFQEEGETISRAALSIGNAAKYLGVHRESIKNILDAYPEIVRYVRGFGRERYLLVEDLLKLTLARPVSTNDGDDE